MTKKNRSKKRGKNLENGDVHRNEKHDNSSVKELYTPKGDVNDVLLNGPVTIDKHKILENEQKTNANRNDTSKQLDQNVKKQMHTDERVQLAFTKCVTRVKGRCLTFIMKKIIFLCEIIFDNWESKVAEYGTRGKLIGIAVQE